MARPQSILSIHIIWRGQKFILQLNSELSLLELGEELRNLTNIKADTMKLIVPESSRKSSKLLAPFSDGHSSIKLQDTGIIEGKPLRMMGVLEDEVDQVLKDSKAKLRIAGFEEEEKRMKERIARGPLQSVKLPQGPYIFCEFRALESSEIELSPPPSEALKRMHMLATDPGIVAIMNKHRWRVGIMTEMAPVGYVGVSPVCLLGLNKNHGEEISLRLRTDDLKGFRKYQVIKKTLLHELAHMVFSEHDENFHALDRQLNQEVFSLDWTRSRSHTLANTRSSEDEELDIDFELDSSLPQKLGGESSSMGASARAASVAAAYNRLADSATKFSGPSSDEDKNDYSAEDLRTSNSVVSMKEEELKIGNKLNGCSNPDELKSVADFSEVGETVVLEATGEVNERIIDAHHKKFDDTAIGRKGGVNVNEEPDPNSDVSDDGMVVDQVSVDTQPIYVENNTKRVEITTEEPDPDDAEVLTNVSREDMEYDHCHENVTASVPDPSAMGFMANEPDPDDEELKRIQDPVDIFCDKVKIAMKTLLNELNPSEVAMIQQTLFKIIRNVSENPNETKYKRLRKANPVFERSIAKHKAALDVLLLVGFSEEVATDETGKTETFLVLKRNDPGLLWLAKSFLETPIVQ